MLAPTWSCKDREPAPPTYRDLSDSDAEPLLPTRGAWKSEAVGNGQAEWIPYREPEAKTPSDAEGEGSEDGGPAGGEGVEGEAPADGAEAAVRALLAEYDELAREQKIEEMLEYHVESQRDTVRVVYESGVAMMEKFRPIRTALEEKLPKEKARIEALFGEFDRKANEGIPVRSLEVVSPTEVVGKLPPGQPVPSVRFLLVDEEWFVEYPGLPPKEQFAAMMQMASAGIDTMSQALSAGQLPPEQLLALLEQQMKTLQGGDETTEAKEPADAEAAPPGTESGD